MKPRLLGYAPNPRAAIAALSIMVFAQHMLRAECPEAPESQPTSVVEAQVSDAETHGVESSVGMDCQGRFLIAWETSTGFGVERDILVRRFLNDGVELCNAGDDCPADLAFDANTDGTGNSNDRAPSR